MVIGGEESSLVQFEILISKGRVFIKVFDPITHVRPKTRVISLWEEKMLEQLYVV